MSRKAPLLAKLTRPRLHRAVRRERLFGVLDQARRTRSTLCVVGPPGAGKTTLVSTWLEARTIRSIWYQVDPGDSDLSTFFYYLAAGAAAQFSKAAHRLPALAPEFLSDIPAFSRRFFRQFFALLPPGTVLVLDNYQEVEATHEFHRIVAEATLELPEDTTLVVISRRDPPDCYARLIASENMAFVDWDQLKLTLEEAELIGGARVEADLELVRILHEHCQGWAAGFTLLLEHARREAYSCEAVKPVAPHAVFDYFATQLFEAFSPETRRTLLALSFLPRMSEEAAEAVAGSTSSVRLLEELHRRRLFTDRRMASPVVYQFHALFLAYLRCRAEQSLAKDEIVSLSRSAALALLHAGYVEDAFPLFLRTADYEASRGLILSHSRQLIAHGRREVVVRWVEALPQSVVTGDCWILLWLGVSHIPIAPQQAREILERSCEQAGAVGDALCELEAAAGIVQTYMFEHARFRPLDHWIELIQRALELNPQFPNADSEARVKSALLVALAYRRPDDPRIDSYADRVLELFDMVEDANLRLTSVAYVLLWGTNTGPIEIGARALPLLRQALQDPGVTPLNAAWSWFIVSWHHCLTSNRAGSDEALEAVNLIAEREGLPAVRKFSAAIASWVEMHVCNIEEAQKWQTQLTQTVDSSSLWDKASVEAGDAWLAVLRNEPRAALRHGTAAVRIFDASGCIMLRTNHRLSCIWANVLLGEFEEARRWITQARRFATRIRSQWQEITLRATEAYIALKTADEALARERLSAAFRMSRETGYHHSLSQHLRPWMSELCAAALEADIESDYVRKLIRMFAWSLPPSRPEKWPWPVTVHTFGHFRILVDGTLLRFGHKAPKKTIALLKALVAFGGIQVPVHRLIDALWSDEDGDHALGAMEVALKRLRTLLGSPDALIVRTGTVSLNRECIWCDVDAFDEGTGTSRNAHTLRKAMDLYRGEFLAEDQNEPWAAPARERFRRRFVHCVEALGRRLEAQLHSEAAIELYLRGLDADPLAEALYQGIIRCHLHDGRKAEGLNVFRRLRQTLSIVLSVEPSPETERLHRALLEL